jgi:hypothetical protein
MLPSEALDAAARRSAHGPGQWPSWYSEAESRKPGTMSYALIQAHADKLRPFIEEAYPSIRAAVLEEAARTLEARRSSLANAVSPAYIVRSLV